MIAYYLSILVSHFHNRLKIPFGIDDNQLPIFALGMAGCHVGCMPTWTIVESKDKYYARIKIMEIVIKALQDAVSCTGKKNRKNA